MNPSGDSKMSLDVGVIMLLIGHNSISKVGLIEKNNNINTQ